MPDDVRAAVRELVEARSKIRPALAFFDDPHEEDAGMEPIYQAARSAENAVSEALARHGALIAVVDGALVMDGLAITHEVEHEADNDEYLTILDARRCLGSLAHAEGPPLDIPLPTPKPVPPPPPEFALSEREQHIIRMARIVGAEDAIAHLLLIGRYALDGRAEG